MLDETMHYVVGRVNLAFTSLFAVPGDVTQLAANLAKVYEGRGLSYPKGRKWPFQVVENLDLDGLLPTLL